MKILLVHNYYKQPGGEDRVFAAEKQLLSDYGHTVREYTQRNDVVEEMNPVAAGLMTIWSRRSNVEFKQVIDEFQPDVVHFHNTFTVISPSAYYVCKAQNIPVVQTLHNYRLICPAATLFRDGRVCEDCVRKVLPLPSLKHKCYHESQLRTGGVVAMLTVHQIMQTWNQAVDMYISLTEDGRQKFIVGGLPAEKIAVKGNFLIDDPGQSIRDDGYMFFMGRLVAEKGVNVLLDAWHSLPDVPLKIAGDGPEMDQMKARLEAEGLTQVELLGHVSHDEAMQHLKRATALLVPSQWYEPFGLVAIEGFAAEKPVIAADLGALSEIVQHEETGLRFDPHNADDLAVQVRRIWQDRALAARWGKNGRQQYLEQYTPASNYERLMAIYAQVGATVTDFAG